MAIALFGDQFRNARAAERNGFGVLFDKTTMSTKTLSAAVMNIVQDKRYWVITRA